MAVLGVLNAVPAEVVQAAVDAQKWGAQAAVNGKGQETGDGYSLGEARSSTPPPSVRANPLLANTPPRVDGDEDDTPNDNVEIGEIKIGDVTSNIPGASVVVSPPVSEPSNKILGIILAFVGGGILIGLGAAGIKYALNRKDVTQPQQQSNALLAGATMAAGPQTQPPKSFTLLRF